MKEYLGVPLTFDDLKKLAREHGKIHILAKLESVNENDYDIFFSDGCSMWPDQWWKIDLFWECLWHDILYFLGGTEAQRLEADERLRDGVGAVAGSVMGAIMFAGVRAGGWVPGTGFEWGYGKL